MDLPETTSREALTAMAQMAISQFLATRPRDWAFTPEMVLIKEAWEKGREALLKQSFDAGVEAMRTAVVEDLEAEAEAEEHFSSPLSNASCKFLRLAEGIRTLPPKAS